ncbi:HAMP domain-containing histidine kinase [Vibrio profundum]|uniref:sensor histidine kinase n=1 Tax=Vibrio profundum TaxID=2910247 RepID=UPI003D0A0A44
MTFDKKLIFLVVVVALLSMLLGYFFSGSPQVSWSALSILIVLLLVCGYRGIHLLQKEVSEKSALMAASKAAEMDKQNKQQLEKANEELRQAQQTLLESEKMVALGSLVAGVAHEVNTPIGISMTASSYIQENVDEFKAHLTSDELSERFVNQFLEDVSESVVLMQTNLKRAVELITSFKQVAVDQASEARYLFHLDEHLQQVVTSLRHKLKKSHAEIEWQCSPELEIDSYPGAFTQIYSNLVLNSILHGFDESNMPHKISIVLSREEGNLIIDYRDNGMGIDAELLPKLFDPFVTTKRGQGGSGLGTHIIYNLVTHKLHGNIRCDSEVGKGAHFHIVIPFDGKEIATDGDSDSPNLHIETKVSYD